MIQLCLSFTENLKCHKVAGSPHRGVQRPAKGGPIASRSDTPPVTPPPETPPPVMPRPVMPPPVMPHHAPGYAIHTCTPTKMGRENVGKAHGLHQPAGVSVYKRRRRAAGTTGTGFLSVWGPEAWGLGVGKAGFLSFLSKAALPGM